MRICMSLSAYTYIMSFVHAEKSQEETVQTVLGWSSKVLRNDAWLGYRLIRWALVLGYPQVNTVILKKSALWG